MSGPWRIRWGALAFIAFLWTSPVHAEPVVGDNPAWVKGEFAKAEEATARGDVESAQEALLRVFTQVGSTRLLRGPRAERGARQRALEALWALDRGPDLPLQVDHYLTLARDRRAQDMRALRTHWEAAGWWETGRDRRLLRRLRGLNKPRRKRTPRPLIQAEHGAMNPLRDAINREEVLTRHALHARAGRVPLLIETTDPAVAESLLMFANLEGRVADAERLFRAVPVDHRPRLLWGLALSYARLALALDLPSVHRRAQELLAVAANAAPPVDRPIPLALSRILPWTRATFFSGLLDAHRGQRPLACATWRELVQAAPHDYYGVLARGRLAQHCEPAGVSGSPETLWARYQRPALPNDPGFDPRTHRFDRPDPRPLLRELPRKGLPRLWMLALARQESGLRSDLCSPSGACGLFQLKPGTARNVQRDLGWSAEPNLADPAVNTAIASAFLTRLERRTGSPLVALAAYNAGPHAVARWKIGDLPGELAMELIPDPRARAYVRGITVRYGLYASWLDNGRLRQPLAGQTPRRILKRADTR